MRTGGRPPRKVTAIPKCTPTPMPAPTPPSNSSRIVEIIDLDPEDGQPAVYFQIVDTDILDLTWSDSEYDE